MANTLTTSSYTNYAKVDTAPPAEGYFTSDISPRLKKIERIFFSLRDGGSSVTGAATVTLQFRCQGDPAWTDYGAYTSIGERKIICENGGYLEWRAIIKEGDFIEGSIIFGFDW